MLAQVTASFQTAPALPEPGVIRRPDSSLLLINPATSAAVSSSRTDTSVQSVSLQHMTKGSHSLISYFCQLPGSPCVAILVYMDVIFDIMQ